MKPENEKKLTCKRCGFVWVPRTARPRCCPGCKSHRWDEVKRVAR